MPVTYQLIRNVAAKRMYASYMLMVRQCVADQELMERRSAELAPVKPNEYKSLPEGFTRSVD